MIEDTLIDGFIYSRDTFEVKYYALDLLETHFDPKKLAEIAREKEQSHALGYLCDIMAEALPKSEQKNKLIKLSRLLYAPPKEWQFLYKSLSEYGKDVASAPYSMNRYNSKWLVYSCLNKVEMSDWFRVYLGTKNAIPR